MDSRVRGSARRLHGANPPKKRPRPKNLHPPKITPTLSKKHPDSKGKVFFFDFILNFSFFVTIYGGVIRLLTQILGLTILTADKYDKRRKITVQI